MKLDLQDLEIEPIEVVDSATVVALEFLGTGHAMTETNASILSPPFVFLCSCCCCC